MRFLGSFPAGCAIVSVLASAPAAAQVVINEAVVDPQRDWNDSTGGTGIGTPFDGRPGTGVATADDEWIELFNKGASPVNLTGWQIIMTDVTMVTEIIGAGGSTLVFSNGGSLTNFKAGEYLILGNPDGTIDNSYNLTLQDAVFNLIDTIFPGSGATPNGDATSTADESIARIPNGADTNVDVDDLRKVSASIGASNARILLDGFESGTFYSWSATFP